MLMPETTAQPKFTIVDVERVLDEVRPGLALHGGGIDLICVDGCDVRVALRGACIGCPSALMTLRESVDRRLREELAGFGELIAEEPRAGTGRAGGFLSRIFGARPVAARMTDKENSQR